MVLAGVDFLGPAVAVAWALIGWSIGHSLGLYSPSSLAGLGLAGIVLLLVVVVRPEARPAWFPLAVAAVAVGAVTEVIVPQWSYVSGLGLMTFVRDGYVLAAHRLLELSPLAVVPLTLWRRTRRAALPVAVAAGVAAGFMVTAASPSPAIDVWYFLQQSAAGLFHGQDMYEGHWVGSPGMTQGYTYMPWTTVVLVPFRELFGDVRYGLVFAMAVGAVFIARIARGAMVAPLFALLVFLVPGGLVLTTSAWTEPLLLAYLAGCILATVSGRTTLAVCSLALAVATKQYTWIFLPLFAVWRPFGLRRTVYATLAGFAISLPWLLAGPAAFWRGVIAYLYDAPTQPSTLSLSGLLVRHHHTMPFLAVAVPTLAALLLCALYTRATGNIAIGCAAVMLAFDLVNHATFYNQWWLVAELLVVGWALSTRLAAGAHRAGAPLQGPERPLAPAG